MANTNLAQVHAKEHWCRVLAASHLELLFVMKFLFGMMEKFCKYTVVMVTQH